MGTKKVYSVSDPKKSQHKTSETSTASSDSSTVCFLASYSLLYTVTFQYHNSHGISWFMAAVFIVGDMMGAGMISLPLSLGRSGLIAGIILILLASLFSGYTGIQLGENWEMMQVSSITTNYKVC